MTNTEPQRRRQACIATISCILIFLIVLAPGSVPSSQVLANAATAEPTHDSTLEPEERRQYIGSVSPHLNVVGAARLFSPLPNSRVRDCVAFIFKGPVMYMFGLFDGYWVDFDIPDNQAQAKLQEAVNFLKANCKAAPVRIMRIP